MPVCLSVHPSVCLSFCFPKEALSFSGFFCASKASVSFRVPMTSGNTLLLVFLKSLVAFCGQSSFVLVCTEASLFHEKDSQPWLASLGLPCSQWPAYRIFVRFVLHVVVSHAEALSLWVVFAGLLTVHSSGGEKPCRKSLVINRMRSACGVGAVHIFKRKCV